MTTAHHVVDERFCEFLADDLGISKVTAMECFMGEPMKLAVKIVTWVDDLEEQERKAWGPVHVNKHFNRTRIVKAWARKNHKGGYRQKRGAA